MRVLMGMDFQIPNTCAVASHEQQVGDAVLNPPKVYSW